MKRALSFLSCLLPLAALGALPVLPQRGMVQDFDTIDQILASTPNQLTDTYIIKGLHAINDGLAGKFYYIPGDASTTNSTDSFAWGTGRIKRTYDGVTASRVTVVGGSTNYVGDLSVGSFLQMQNVTAGQLAVFDANKMLTNGTASAFGATTINPTDNFIPYRLNSTTFSNSPIERLSSTAIGVDTINVTTLKANTATVTNLTGGVVQSSAAGLLSNAALTPTFIPYAVAAGLADSPFYRISSTNIGFDGQFTLGPGTTNVLYRNAKALIYTNSGTSGVLFSVVNGAGNHIDIGETASGNTYVDGSNTGAGTFSIIGPSSYGFNLQAGKINPITASTDLSGPNVTTGFWWHDIGLDGQVAVRGFFSGSDQSYMSLRHGGTNGTVTANSVGSGIAGNGKPFLWQIDSTNIFRIDGLSGASTTGLLLYENGTLQRVTVGVADSGGAGFRVLRIPN